MESFKLIAAILGIVAVVALLVLKKGDKNGANRCWFGALFNRTKTDGGTKCFY